MKGSRGTKIFTVSYLALLFCLLIFFVVYLNVGPDFKDPAENAAESEEPQDVLDENAYTIWEYTLDDVWDYLVECGLLTKEDVEGKMSMSVIGTDNWIISGIDFVRWDVDNLTEGTESYDYWNELNSNGYIMFGGTVYFLQQYGPFGVYVNSTYPGKSEDVYNAMANFPQNYSKQKYHE